MKVIGITGPSGAGKTSVSEELRMCGAYIIDADLISRQITKKGEKAYKEIIDVFGEEILSETREINRRVLGEIVFNCPEKLELLERITHKHIFEKMTKMLNEADAEVVVLDVPLLFQCDFPIQCDLTVSVIADIDVRIKRIMKRDGITKKEAEARIKNQLPNSEYERLSDVCFFNSEDMEEVKSFAKDLYNLVLNK